MRPLGLNLTKVEVTHHREVYRMSKSIKKDKSKHGELYNVHGLK